MYKGKVGQVTSGHQPPCSLIREFSQLPSEGIHYKSLAQETQYRQLQWSVRVLSLNALKTYISSQKGQCMSSCFAQYFRSLSLLPSCSIYAVQILQRCRCGRAHHAKFLESTSSKHIIAHGWMIHMYTVGCACFLQLNMSACDPCLGPWVS